MAVNTVKRTKTEQPLGVINIPGARLRIETVEALVGFGRSTIYKRLAEKKFPEPIRTGSRCSRWCSDDIRAYLAAK